MYRSPGPPPTSSAPRALRRGRLRLALRRLKDSIKRSPRLVQLNLERQPALPEGHVEIDLLAGLDDSAPVSEPPEAQRPERLLRERTRR